MMCTQWFFVCMWTHGFHGNWIVLSEKLDVLEYIPALGPTQSERHVRSLPYAEPLCGRKSLLWGHKSTSWGKRCWLSGQVYNGEGLQWNGQHDKDRNPMSEVV